MRVATRRLRTAVSVFSAALPPELLAVRPNFGWVADVLGEVRDLDVQLEWLHREAAASEGVDEASVAPLVELLDGRREEARDRMLAALDSPRYASLVTVMTGMVRAGETTDVGSTPAARTMPDLLRRRWRRFNRVARALEPDSSDDDFHDARLRAKRIRYATQYAAGLYGGAARPFVAAMKGAQDQLGRRQDAVVALARRTTAAGAVCRFDAVCMERLATRDEVVRSWADVPDASGANGVRRRSGPRPPTGRAGPLAATRTRSPTRQSGGARQFASFQSPSRGA